MSWNPLRHTKQQYMTVEEAEKLVKHYLSKDGKTLDLTAMHLEEYGAKDIASCELLQEVTTLEFGRNICGPKGARYTRARRPVILVHTESHDSQSEALKAEHAFKRLSRRQKLARLSGDRSQEIQAGSENL